MFDERKHSKGSNSDEYAWFGSKGVCVQRITHRTEAEKVTAMTTCGKMASIHGITGITLEMLKYKGNTVIQ